MGVLLLITRLRFILEAISWIIEAEGSYFRGVIYVSNDIKDRSWEFLVSKPLPVDAIEEGMGLELLMAFHTEACLRVHLKERVDQRDEALVFESRWELKFPRTYLVEHLLVSSCGERRNTAGHLVEDHTQGPEVSEGTGHCVVKHLWRYVEWCSYEGVPSFWRLVELHLLGVEWSIIVFAVI